MRALVTGASGQVGTYLLRHAPDCQITAWSGRTTGAIEETRLVPIQLADSDQVAAAFRSSAPQIVIHSAAMSRVAECYQQPQAAERINALATRQLVELCAQHGARLLYVSTDMVFDGEKGSPYHEQDVPAPLSQYGLTKRLGETFVVNTARGVVARLSLLVGARLYNGTSFFDEQYRTLRAGQPLKLFVDEWRTPLDYNTAAKALWALALSDVTGILHIGGPERLSRWDIGVQLAEHLGADQSSLQAIRQADQPAPEPRPRDLSLDSSRWRKLFPQIPWRPWIESLSRD